jgi:hypothetical protein
VRLVVADDDRFLEFEDPASGKPVQVYPTSETGQTTSGLRRVSKTWNFEQDGRKYRVQLQVTHPEQT